MFQYLSHSQHVIAPSSSLPYLFLLPSQSDCKSDGRAIWQQHKGPWFLLLWLWLWWWLVFISTIWWNPWLKLTGVEQVQYPARWRIPVMSPQRGKQKNGLLQHPLVTPNMEQFLIIGWEGSPTTSSLWKGNDLWLLVRHKAVICQWRLCYHGTCLNCLFLCECFHFCKRTICSLKLMGGDINGVWKGSGMVW